MHRFQQNTELNNYMALSEKTAEDRKQEWLLADPDDTLGHAPTGSRQLHVVGVLIDIDPNRAKEQVKVTKAVQGIKDSERPSNCLRPGALRPSNLKDALKDDPRVLGRLTGRLIYTKWMGRCRYGRLRCRSFMRPAAPHAVRHGHASQMSLHFFEDEEDYLDRVAWRLGFRLNLDPWLSGAFQADDGNQFHPRRTAF